MSEEEIEAQKEAELAAKAEADLSQKHTRTEKEKAEYTLRKQAERVKELGGDPSQLLGVLENPDEVPAWYKKEKSKEVTSTALSLADGIADEDERTQVKNYLNTRIIPSGNAEDDFRLAFGAVRATKNQQIIEDANRRTSPRLTAAGGSKPMHIEEQFTPTAEESVLMGRPYNLSKEKIIEARKRQQERDSR
jgi:hypothetical protein